ncbi:argininosuccinate synthase [Erythrobacter sp. NAP1]|uniref:hypothetical protein n=1 Tax=Erythrobacter sp. NAP1 TaxID=237727 RepID=UPI0000686B19|nr:hypothetical protein [Erythrobacter sp. NAP1]EAQ30526.1 argininosuccinate synthase [Erythrobacter sp. NAP1]
MKSVLAAATLIAFAASGAYVDEILHADHADHALGADCGHDTMNQHGSHMDFVHAGRLHHMHGDHFDDHGPVKMVSKEQLARR